MIRKSQEIQQMKVFFSENHINLIDCLFKPQSLLIYPTLIFHFVPSDAHLRVLRGKIYFLQKDPHNRQ